MTPPTMTIREILKLGERELVRGGVPNARRNAEWMLCHALACTPLYLHTNANEPVDPKTAHVFVHYVDRRAGREPLQYVLETTEFMGLPFEMREGVFIPRPETETLVEEAAGFLRSLPIFQPLHLLDLCCGSGVVGVSLASAIPNLQVSAVDINPEAVRLTRHNATSNQVGDRVQAVCADAAWFLRSTRDGNTDWPHRYTMIACNPPYIASNEVPELAPEVADWDPIEALDGGDDGLDFYRMVVPRMRGRMEERAAVVFEIGSTQGDAVETLLQRAGFAQVRTVADLAGRDRVVAGTLPGESEQ